MSSGSERVNADGVTVLSVLHLGAVPAHRPLPAARRLRPSAESRKCVRPSGKTHSRDKQPALRQTCCCLSWTELLLQASGRESHQNRRARALRVSRFSGFVGNAACCCSHRRTSTGRRRETGSLPGESFPPGAAQVSVFSQAASGLGTRLQSGSRVSCVQDVRLNAEQTRVKKDLFTRYYTEK